MYEYTGLTALVTGASSGIGAEFAKHLADRGANLILVARRIDALKTLAAELHERCGVSVTPIEWDLSLPNAGRELVLELERRSLQVDVVVNSAGFGNAGTLAEGDPSVLSSEMNVNMNAVADITRGLVSGMVERNKGVVINVASLAALAPRANHAMYSATKAFVLSLTEALWGELRHTGVRVTAVCPGPTDTGFFAVSGTPVPGGKAQPASAVVDSALRAIDRGKKRSIPAPWTMKAAMKLMAVASALA